MHESRAVTVAADGPVGLTPIVAGSLAGISIPSPPRRTKGGAGAGAANAERPEPAAPPVGMGVGVPRVPGHVSREDWLARMRQLIQTRPHADLDEPTKDRLLDEARREGEAAAAGAEGGVDRREALKHDVASLRLEQMIEEAREETMGSEATRARLDSVLNENADLGGAMTELEGELNREIADIDTLLGQLDGHGLQQAAAAAMAMAGGQAGGEDGAELEVVALPLVPEEPPQASGLPTEEPRGASDAP
jgi:hypothetical protein